MLQFQSRQYARSVPFIVIFLFALFFIFVSVDPPSILFLLPTSYSLSGYVMWLLEWRRRGKGKAGSEAKL